MLYTLVMRKIIFLALLPILMMEGVQWRAIESENFRIAYPAGFEAQAKHAASWIETYRDSINALTGWEPKKVWLVLEDIGMSVNGFANPVSSEIHLFTTPPTGYNLSTKDWMRTVGVHEYTHISSLQPVYGFPKLLNILTGPWIMPNVALPGWMIEGVTVYQESQIEPYEGRLQAGEYSAFNITRIAQKDYVSKWDMQGAITKYPAGAIYAYGGPFYQWMVRTKGKDKISAFYRLNGRNIPFFFVNGAAKKTIGENFPELIRQWQTWEKEQSTGFILPDSVATKLTNEGYYISTLTSDKKYLYYVRIKNKKRAALNSRWYIDIIKLEPETGQEEVLLRPNIWVKSLKIHDNVLYYTNSTTARGFANINNNGFGDLVQINSLNLISRRLKKIYEGRVRAFDKLPDGSFIISIDRTPKYGSRLILLDENGQEQDELYSGKRLIGEIAISNNGDIYTTCRQQGKDWDIFQFSPDSKEWTQLTSTEWSEAGISLTEEGNLLYSANPYGPQGRIGIYEMNKKTAVSKQFSSPSYALMPAIVKDKLIFISLNSSGEDIYCMAPQSSLATFPKKTAGNINEPKYDGDFKTHSSFYPYISLLRPWLRLPYVWPEFNDNWSLSNFYLGILLYGGDVLGENSYNIHTNYDFIAKTSTLDFYWQNKSLAPLKLQLDYSHKPKWDSLATRFEYDYSIYPSFSYPIYSRKGIGLQNISWKEGFKLNGRKLENRVLVSKLSASFSWYHYQMGLSMSHNWTSPLFASYEASRLSLRASGVVDLFGGILIADASSILHLSAQLPDSFKYRKPIRGYDSLTSRNNIFNKTTLEYRHQLIKMRFGIWNPNIFFEDLYVNIFADAAFDTQNLLGASAGIELSPEIHLLWEYFKLAPIFGGCITMEGNFKPYVALRTWMPFEIGLSENDALHFISNP